MANVIFWHIEHLIPTATQLCCKLICCRLYLQAPWMNKQVQLYFCAIRPLKTDLLWISNRALSFARFA